MNYAIKMQQTEWPITTQVIACKGFLTSCSESFSIATLHSYE